jgi:hypothetical protein
MSDSPADQLVVIDGHICGLPGVGFGGYVGGLLAAELGAPAKVDFLRPAPLGIRLRVEHDQAGEARLLDGEVVLAVGRPYETSDAHPAPPAWEEAVHASQAYVAMTDNEYPNCFGCGPAVPDGKGMRVFTGPIRESDLVATAWAPSEAFAGADGTLLTAFVWSALDCPGGLARRQFLTSEPAVTAYLAVKQLAPILAGRPHVVIGWPIHHESRKSLVGVAVFDREDVLCARGEALWVAATH